MAEQEDTGLLREIDEELRQEQAASLAKQYGKYVVAGAILLVVGVGGYKAWDTYQQDQRVASTAAYLDAMALAEAGNAGDAASQFESLVADGAGALDQLARLRRAALLAEADDVVGAIAAYRAIAGDESVEHDIRALAAIYLSTHLLNQGDAEGARAAVAPYTSGPGPWRYAALEAAALADLELGDDDAARTNLNVIAESNAAPRDMRSRAAVLLRTMPEAGDNG